MTVTLQQFLLITHFLQHQSGQLWSMNTHSLKFSDITLGNTHAILVFLWAGGKVCWKAGATEHYMNRAFIARFQGFSVFLPNGASASDDRQRGTPTPRVYILLLHTSEYCFRSSYTFQGIIALLSILEIDNLSNKNENPQHFSDPRTKPE